MIEVLPYTKLASIYDRLMDHVDYASWSEYILGLLGESRKEINSLIDISCGTGNMLYNLRNKIRYLSGCDSSEQMIEHARKKNKTISLYLNTIQDLAIKNRQFDCVLCLYDSLNYLTDPDTLSESIHEVNRILTNGGIFVFDVVSDFYCRKYYSDFHESEYWDNAGYTIHSFYDQKYSYQYTEFRIVLSGKTFIERHRQRVYTPEFLSKILKKNSFKLLGMYDDFSLEKSNNQSGRIHFLCSKI